MVESQLNYKDLAGKSKEEIIDLLLNQVQTEENEKNLTISENEKRNIHLKIMIIKSYGGFTPELINKVLNDQYFNKVNENKKLRDFVDKTVINVEKFNEKIYHLEIELKKFKKHFHFILFLQAPYWLIYTLVRKDDFNRSIDRLLRYLPDLEKTEIPPRFLENLGRDEEFKPSIKGFIARYNPYYGQRKRSITVDVYGGDLEDLDTIRNSFFVEPTTLSFHKENSPLVEGKMFTEGLITIGKYNGESGNEIAKKTINEITRYFIEKNDKVFEQVERFENVPSYSKNHNCLKLNSQYCLVLKVKQERFDNSRKDSITIQNLNASILKYFENRKTQYFIFSEGEFSHFIFDRNTRNKVQLTIEPKFKTIILYPFKNCKDRTIRDIVSGFSNWIEASFESIEPFYFTY